MLVVPIASTFLHIGDDNPLGYQIHYDGSHGIDQLAEAAGRVCYQSFSRPNPKTATNQGYLHNIIDQGHFSVLEHGSVSFYVEGVSRSLLTELERHRFLSFSVISQRYVRHESADVVTPPAILGQAADSNMQPMHEFDAAVDRAFIAYEFIAENLIGAGFPKKKAMEAARAVLPNATEVKMVVTGNMRCWLDVIGKRYHEAADAEIRQFVTEILGHLREFAPNCFQHVPDQPYS